MRFFFSLISTLQLLEYANEGFLTGPPSILLNRENKLFLGRNNISVGIIGAGFAGLSAYNQLVERGFSNVHLFEANQRVGGRVFPLEFEGIYLQHGAEFINGKDNPIYEMAQRLGSITGEVDDSEMIADGKALFASHEGCHVSPETMAKFTRLTDELELKYAQMAASESQLWNVSIGNLFEQDFGAFLRTAENSVSSEICTQYQSLAQMYRSYYEGEWSAPIDQLALHNYAQWKDGSHSFPFGSYTLDSRGYTPILEELSRNIPLDKLHFGSRVVNIDYSEEKIHLKLQNADDSQGLQRRPDSFDFVIVTVPIGHLKRFAHSLFTPSLPTAKLDAIHAIGFGQMQKLFLVYDRPFWDENMRSLVALNCSNQGGIINRLKESLHTFQPHPWASNKILVVWLSGNGPKLLNGIEDEELDWIVTEHLHELLPNNTQIELPKRIIRTKWLEDDLFLGSYTFITPEASTKFGPDPFAILAAPIFYGDGEKPRVLFAGEGTHSQMFQTTIGAFLSGRREPFGQLF